MGTKTDTSMKKDVIITIASKQNFEGCEPDHINLITAATASTSFRMRRAS